MNFIEIKTEKISYMLTIHHFFVVSCKNENTIGMNPVSNNSLSGIWPDIKFSIQYPACSSARYPETCRIFVLVSDISPDIDFNIRPLPDIILPIQHPVHP